MHQIAMPRVLNDFEAIHVFEAALTGPPALLPYRAEMERAFGEDFSTVCVYFGQSGIRGALGVDAATRGEDIAFASWAPTREQVAHELAHVVQSRRTPRPDRGLNRPDDPAEREACQVAAQVAAGFRVVTREAASALIQCAWPTNLTQGELTTLRNTEVPANFSQLWGDPQWRSIYQRWAIANHMGENPAFLHDVEEYRRDPGPVAAMRLCDAYINPPDPNRPRLVQSVVNISGPVRQEITQVVNDLNQGAGSRAPRYMRVPANLFDAAYAEVRGPLELDYRNFRTEAQRARQ
jgi:hypothetical protein